MILIFAPSPMIFFLISCFSFILIFKSCYVTPNWSQMVKFLTLSYWVQMCNSFVGHVRKRGGLFGVFEAGFSIPMMKNHASFELGDDIVEKGNVGISLLDLPDLPLDLILEQLQPGELCSMAGVCGYLRAKCRSDHMWETHMKKKWGRVMGNAALREWHWNMATNNNKFSSKGVKNGGFFKAVFTVWPFTLLGKSHLELKSEINGDLPPDSIMAWYLALETGQFWFPAQVYNRENGHDGFMLSCYDADLCYNLETDTFHARYSPHGRRTIEENITWCRVRAAPIDTPPYVLHVSDCLDDLKPGDHFEIQWRRNKEYPYGWWYGVVGHLDSCSGNQIHCGCHENDTVILEFNQYATDSRWRRMKVRRTSHREKGNEADGFYGGLRKIYSQEEISTWKSLWPTKILS